MQSNNSPQHIFFVGICGTGMYALASYAHQAGYAISGSDAKLGQADEGLRGALEGMTENLYAEHDSKNISDSVHGLVYSSAIPEDNPEIIEAKKRGLKIWHRAELLASFMEGKFCICVSGTHGKSTVTAIIAHVFRENGISPSVYIGAYSHTLKAYATLGQSPVFIAECDESDGSFKYFKPNVAIVTTIENDHLDFYGDFDSMVDAFRDFVGSVNPDNEGNAIILGWDNANSRALADHSPREIVYGYGFNIGCDFRCLSFEGSQGSTSFEVVALQDIISVTIPLIGKFNVYNALAALAASRQMGIGSIQFANSIASFAGLKKRQEILFSADDVTVISDYAHNPGKIAAMVEACRTSWPQAQLNVIFEAHKFARLNKQLDEFCQSFKAADYVLVTPIFEVPAADKSEKKISTTELAAAIKKASQTECASTDSINNDTFKMLPRPNNKKSINLFLGAGNSHEYALQAKQYFQ